MEFRQDPPACASDNLTSKFDATLTFVTVGSCAGVFAGALHAFKSRWGTQPTTAVAKWIRLE